MAQTDFSNLRVASVTEVHVLEPSPAQPDLIYVTPGGAEMRLSDYRGKVLLINLWASWCAPCRKELPVLDKLQGELGDEFFEIVLISMDDDEDEMMRLFGKMNMRHLTPWRDGSRASMDALQTRSIPLSIFYTPDGRELFRIDGDVDWESPQGRRLIEIARDPENYIKN